MAVHHVGAWPLGRYDELADRVAGAFRERFLARGTGRFGMATQACQATALYMGLVPDDEREAAVRALADSVTSNHDGHIATGIFGTKYLLDVLPRVGLGETAYRLVNQESYPGWGYILATGATTLWETWAFSDDVYSHNHPMFGSVSEWLVKSVGGIRPAPDAVGFDRFEIAPVVVDGLTSADAGYCSVRGPIASHWRIEGRRLRLEVSVPPNTSARVHIPTPDASSVTERGLPIDEVDEIVKVVSRGGDAAIVELGSGQYVSRRSRPGPLSQP